MIHAIWPVVALAAVLAVVLRWAFRNLPSEGWQMLATVPRSRQAAGHWSALNLTYYGVFQGTACAVAVALLVVLLGAIEVPTGITLAVVGVGLGICVPATRWVARLVEGQDYTFTVGGASVLGFLLLPVLVSVASHFSSTELPLQATLAAFAISYALGESVGRLACISFGCCYGKPLDECTPLIQRLFQQRSFVFAGETKKAAYEGKFAGRPLFPIQAVTSVALAGVALSGIFCFLAGWYMTSLLVTVVGIFAWRFASEFLRADFRGTMAISAYQWMALTVIGVYAVMAALLPTTQAPAANLALGLSALWHPLPILTIEGVALAVFLFTGRSEVTAAHVSFHVCYDKLQPHCHEPAHAHLPEPHLPLGGVGAMAELGQTS